MPVYDFDENAYSTIIVPTRNRPTSLRCLLAYLGKFYPGAKLVIADGSMPESQFENEAICREASGRLQLDYRAFDADIAFTERVRTVLESLPEDQYVFGADDDFPVLEVLGAARRFLEQNSDYSVCGGYNYRLNIGDDGKMRRLMFNARSIEDNRASERYRRYADLDFHTYYCVASRSHFLSRYDRIEETFIVGFGDYMLGFHDLMHGKLKVKWSGKFGQRAKVYPT